MEDSSGLPAVVVKLGGSLLDLQDLAARLQGLFSVLDHPVAMVVGGGPAADVVRRWDEINRFSGVAAHGLAIRAMRLTERLIQEINPEAVVVESLAACRRAAALGQFMILAVEPLLQEATAEHKTTPAPTWDATSDTLAAWCAKRIGVRRLVLVKSVDAPSGGIAAAAKLGLVDPLFERTAEGLDISWVNLRSDCRSAAFRRLRHILPPDPGGISEASPVDRRTPVTPPTDREPSGRGL